MKTIKTLHYHLRSYSRLFLCFLFIYNIAVSWAQDLPCANEVFQTKQLQDAAFIRQLLSMQQAAAAQRPNGTVLEIPIVVHVLHLGEEVGQGSNISDQQIYDAVEATNKRWRNTYSTGTNSLDMEVQFCLAQFDPEGNPSNGIVRKDASAQPLYSDIGIGYIEAMLEGVFGSDEIQTKNLSNWPHSYAFNIWVVHKIAGGWGGYAFFPLPNGEYSTDGVVITAGAMRNTSSTLAHELGHAMGLFHTFQGSENGCPPNDLCFIQGDWICDTPPHKRPDCSNTECNNSADSAFSFKNIMSYCGGRDMFTQGQKDRVRTTIFNSSRNILLQSIACTGLTTSIHANKKDESFKIFPNPASRYFIVYSDVQSNDNASLEIINMLGEVVLTKALGTGKEHSISIPDLLTKGIYHVQIKKNQQITAGNLLNIF